MTGDLQGTIAMSPARLAIRADEEQSCCGANWAGVGRIQNRPKPLKRCRVTASKVPFHAADESVTKSYVVEGDWVEIAAWTARDSKYVVARFVGKKKVTAGLLPESGLTCR